MTLMNPEDLKLLSPTKMLHSSVPFSELTRFHDILFGDYCSNMALSSTIETEKKRIGTQIILSDPMFHAMGRTIVDTRLETGVW